MTVINFKSRYPQFESIENEDIETVLAEAKIIATERAYSDKVKIAVFLLVAHELTLSSISKTGGAIDKVISRSIEGGSVTIANTQAKDQFESYYQKSIYGEKFLSIKKTRRFAGAVLI